MPHRRVFYHNFFQKGNREMKKLKLCNVHRLALSNEGEARKPIHIPFGTWPYDDRVSQTLDREHAEKIANELAASVAKGEPGIPVYQGHPDVPEYAGKYPDKGALGWVKKILVNENGMDLEVEWDRDPGKGFGWFSPYWTGDDPGPDASGKRNVVVDGLTSIGLVNNPNIREFRLANEAVASSASDGRPAYKMPQHLIDLAKRFDDRAALANEANYDESKHPRGEDGKWTSGGGAGSGGGKISVGDKITLSATHPRHANKQATVTHVYPTGFVKVKTSDGKTDIELNKSAKTELYKELAAKRDKSKK